MRRIEVESRNHIRRNTALRPILPYEMFDQHLRKPRKHSIIERLLHGWNTFNSVIFKLFPAFSEAYINFRFSMHVITAIGYEPRTIILLLPIRCWTQVQNRTVGRNKDRNVGRFRHPPNAGNAPPAPLIPAY